MAINKDFAKSIVLAMANYLEIPPCEITFLKMEGNYRDVAGFYVDGKNIININSTVLKGFSELEFASFLIHEMRHAYQYWQIKNRTNESKETVDIWKKEFVNYKGPNLNSNEYLRQSIEIDAIAFTAFFTKKYFNQKLIIPQIIEKEVEKRIDEITKKYNYK